MNVERGDGAVIGALRGACGGEDTVNLSGEEHRCIELRSVLGIRRMDMSKH
jgi:hypothetical protein